MENRISFSLDDVTKADINGHYTELDKAMDFLIALDKSEKRGHLILGTKQAGISSQVYEWLVNNPNRFTETDRTELGKDISLRNDLAAIKARHDEIGEKLASTITRTSQEILFEMRLLKRDVDTAILRDPSLKPLKAMLDGLFER